VDSELKRQRFMMLGLTLAALGVSFGGGLERALFVPSDIVAALNANPLASRLDEQPFVAPSEAPLQKARARKATALAQESAPISNNGTNDAPPFGVLEAPVVVDEPVAPPAEPQLALASGPPVVRRAGFPGNLGGGVPTGPDIYSGTPTEPLPEPEVWAMMASGLLVAGWSLRRRRARSTAA